MGSKAVRGVGSSLPLNSAFYNSQFINVTSIQASGLIKKAKPGQPFSFAYLAHI